MRIIYNLFQSSKIEIKYELSSNEQLKFELKQFLKISFDSQDYKSHIYILGVFPAFSRLCPEDIMNCEVFSYLVNTELVSIWAKDDELSFLFTPIYVALTSLVGISIPLINQEILQLLTSLCTETFKKLKTSQSESLAWRLTTIYILLFEMCLISNDLFEKIKTLIKDDETWLDFINQSKSVILMN